MEGHILVGAKVLCSRCWRADMALLKWLFVCWLSGTSVYCNSAYSSGSHVSS
jgi:hypothetical protein